MEENNLLERVIDQKEDFNVQNVLEEYFSGTNGVFDISAEYIYTDYLYQVRFSPNKVEEVASTALNISSKYFSVLRSDDRLSSLSDDELSVLSAWMLSKEIEKIEVKHNANWIAETSTEKEADHYQEKNMASGNPYLGTIIRFYQESQKQK